MVNQLPISFATLNLGPLRWPESLEEIRITEDEKTSLEKTINALRSNLGVLPQSFIERQSAQCPRKVIVTNSHCFVVLSSKQGMAPFRLCENGKKKVKWVWECTSGSLWLEKPAHSSKEKNVISMWNFYRLNHLKVARGLLDLYENQADEVFGDSPVYYEKKGSIPLQEWLKEHPYAIQPQSLKGVLNALKQLHSMEYQPPQSITPRNCLLSRSFYQGTVQGLFYGHIGPEKFFCEFDEGKTSPRIVLTVSSHLGALHQIQWKGGWGSPETVRLSLVDSRFQDVVNFNLNYGRKKDSWTMGLLIGSLLKGGFASVEGFSLPHFSFITNRIKIIENEVNDLGIAGLKQSDVDDELTPLIKQEKDEKRKKLWIKVKKWLTVDPDKRPTMASL